MLDRAETATATPGSRSRGYAIGGGAEPSPVDAATILASLRRRKWLLLASILLCPLLTAIAIVQLTPRYTATGSLLYDASEYKVRELQSILRVDPVSEAVIASQAEVLRGVPVVEQVVNRLNLLANPEFNTALRAPSWLRRTLIKIYRAVVPRVPPPAAETPGPRLDPQRNATLQAVQAALTVTPIKGSHVLEVSFPAEDPVIAAAAVNIAMDYYVKSQLGTKFGAVSKAHQWLLERRDTLRREVREQEDAVEHYRARNGLVEGMHARLGSEQISLLTETIARARSALAEAESRLDAASGRAGAAAQAEIAPSVVQLRARHDQLSGQLQSMLGRLGPSHPDVQALRAQLTDVDRTIAAEIGRVVAAAEAEVRADRERVEVLQKDLGGQQALIARDSQAQVPLNAMLRDLDASRSLLQAVLERIEQITQQQSIEAPDAHEISLALIPERASYPRTVPWLAGATVFGFALGLLLVYAREQTDGTFHSSEDVRAALGVPCMALIPTVPRYALGDLSIEAYAAKKPRSVLAEQLRTLRAALLWPGQPRIVAITAASAQEGKTTVTRTLARLAAMNGERVIVVDCDLRHTASSKRTPSLLDFLRNKAQLADIIRKDPTTGTDSIPGGKWEANALGLLMSAAMAQLLQTLRQDYDLVLLDTPPAEPITDARIVAGLAEATVLCVRWRSTSSRVAQRTLERLEEAHANVVGVALTRVDVGVHVRSGYADAEAYHPRYGGYFRE
ncbi:MAG TPA: AAA family ATPase [Acetobacteraceae bacterium]|nr:AAA family ATPase [Acetobacteraceae bacterium]